MPVLPFRREADCHDGHDDADSDAHQVNFGKVGAQSGPVFADKKGRVNSE